MYVCVCVCVCVCVFVIFIVRSVVLPYPLKYTRLPP